MRHYHPLPTIHFRLHLPLLAKLVFSVCLLFLNFVGRAEVAWSAESSADDIIIGSSTKIARPGEALLLTGQGLGSAHVYSSDGTQTIEATILNRGPGRVTVEIPSAMGSGTLWVRAENGQKVSNQITVNSPEPWWVQPDIVDLNGTTRIFGRAFDSLGIGASVQVILEGDTGQYVYQGTVSEPNVVTLPVYGVDNRGRAIPYGSYRLYLKEPKNEERYGPFGFTVAPAFVPLNYAVSVSAYGAVPNDEVADNAAFIAAFRDIASRGGGTLFIPEGRFVLDETYGYAPGSSILPTVANRTGGYRIQGAGRDKTILEFKPSAKITAVVFWGVTLYDNCSLSDLTIKASTNYFPANNTLVKIAGDHSSVRNVRIDSDLSPALLTPLQTEGDYALIDSVEIRNPGKLYFNGRQIQITNVTHYGAKAIEFYDLSALSDISNIFGSLFVTTGANEAIFEHNLGESRWEEERGHFKRFFVGQIHGGSNKHIYIGHNVVRNHISQAVSNSAECILFEGVDSFYNGHASLSDPISLHLTDGTITDVRAYHHQQLTPLVVAVRSGNGMGEVRHGILDSDGVTLRLDAPFAIPFDATTEIVVGFFFEENIVYANQLEAGSIYPDASVGVQLYGNALSNVIRNNTIKYYRDGYLDWVYHLPGQLSYFNQVTDNEIIGTVRGVGTVISNGISYPAQALGNVYRRNNIHDMNRTFPAWYSRENHEGLGIRYYAQLSPPADAVIASIYEGNTVRDGVNGMHADIVTDNLIVRHNQFARLTGAGIVFPQGRDNIVADNETDVLPQITVSNSSAKYKLEFKSAIGAYGNFVQAKDSYYMWSTKGSGTLTFAIVDPDGDAIAGPTLTPANLGIRLEGQQLIWSNLANGLYRFSLAASTAKGTATRNFYLFVGTYEDFEGVKSISSREIGLRQSVTIATPQGDYATSVSPAYPAVAGTRYEHLVATASLYSDSTKVLKISALNQETKLDKINATDVVDAPHENAVLSLVTNLYSSTHNAVFKIRLNLDDHNYYELSDYPFAEPVFKLRTLTKVVNDITKVRIEKIATGRTESALIFQKKGQRIVFEGWGDSMEFTDPTPLPITAWSLSYAAFPGKDDRLIQYASWITLDNLFFVVDGTPVIPTPSLPSIPSMPLGLHVTH